MRPVAPSFGRAWVLGSTDPFVELRLLEGGSISSTDTGSPNGGTWKQIQAYTLAGSEPLSIALSSGQQAGARTILVDDLAVWQSAETDCSKAP